jgi:hypothetical protein
MSNRQFETTNQSGSNMTLTNRTDAPEGQTIQVAEHALATFVLPVSSGDPRPQAAALTHASGGRLSRAGASLLQLQRSYGNRHVQQVVECATPAPVIQTKLVLGPADDRYEREADRVARQVASGAGGPALDAASRTPAIQSLANAQGGAVDADVQQAIQQARGGGQPLPEHVRGSMEQALGANFGGVRLHTDAQSDQLNRSLQARAFTTGQDIFLRRGEYSPGSSGGRELLAHELTHVVQQQAGWVAAADLAGPASAAPIQRTPKKLKRILRFFGMMAPHAAAPAVPAAPAATPLDDFVTAYEKARYYHGTRGPDQARSIHERGLLNYDDRVATLGHDVPGMSRMGGSEYAGDEKKGVFLGGKNFMGGNVTIPPFKVRLYLPANRTVEHHWDDDVPDNQLMMDEKFRGGGLITKNSIPAEQAFFGDMSDLIEDAAKDDEAGNKLASILTSVASQYQANPPELEEMANLLREAIRTRRLSNAALDNWKPPLQ